MKSHDYAQVGLYLFGLVLLTPPIGLYMAKVFQGEKTFFTKTFGWLENITYKVCGIKNDEMDWKTYAKALLVFNFLGLIFVFAIELLQGVLPLNPQKLPGVPLNLALNTAVSFMTNTNWQAYAGENTLSYLTQMLALGVQNFLSAATGFAVLLALARGISRKTTHLLGNFWIDLTRVVYFLLLPLSIVLSLVLLAQGVVQSFAPYLSIKTVEGLTQMIPLGPAASQIAIKQLGTNGGGFFGANSAHPFENPTGISNFLEMFVILLLPSALVYTYGVITKNMRHARVIFAVMVFVFCVSLAASLYAEHSINPVLGLSGVMEGKEVRFGVTNSVIWSTATTLASNGSVNAMHSSLSPLAGGVALFNIMLGEIIFGGVGSGLYGMLLFIFLTVFLAGLMVGRTPEYLGKKIEGKEIQMVILAILLPSAVILVGAGIASISSTALSSLGNKGPHGLTEILYAFTSAAGNNGSAFGGLNVNTDFFNLTLSLAMLVGRFAVIIPCLAIAGSLAQKKISPPSAGTFSTETPIFGLLLLGVIVIVGALTFLPCLSLGPIVEHFLMNEGRVF